MKTKLKKNDEVVVLAGKEKGKSGRILAIQAKNNTATVQELNMLTKHKKPSQQNTEGGIVTFEGPIHLSNLALVVKKAAKGKPAMHSKLGFKVDKEGKKIRIARKTGKEV
ncbi:50S ribosomal protein L24 [Mycoplasmopsis californica]|uniref:Large ribosomal subunit protein uL24 n=1 Tax=Mycoplasmopsis equigenitalium TaxID=114883 RepID=A0ABY5J273_9BACT|nr:50S ribosomal protein L24 [Mycoplasmopsis equigenitalium]UUD37095.1 50S ribosomal protein L24 [Mycoplasmopsis equigenitalium]VEU69603.1 50S ribosomal protein L24 [Mycoplasmopsis californica]